MEPKCSICGQTSTYICGNLFLLKTSISKTPLTSVITRISGKNEHLLDKLQEDFLCQECLLKVDEYDEAYTRAKHLEGHLQYLLENRTNREHWTNCHSNSIFHFKNINLPKRTRKSKPKDVLLELDPFSEDSDKKEKVHPKDCADVAAPSPLSPNDSLSKTEENGLDECSHVSAQWNECEICGKPFSSKSKLTLHQQTHKKRVKCEICDKNFKNEVLLEIHRQTHDGKSELECVDCSKVFSSKGALIKHIRIHKGEYLYQCEHCGKQFIHDSSMRMHKMGHEDSRDKKCPVCERGFRSTQHLQRHLRTHTGEKPYYCKKCGKKFAQKYNMMTHYSKVHSIAVQKRMIPCAHCAKSFAQRFQLREHIGQVHSSLAPDSPGEPATEGDSGEPYAEYLLQPDCPDQSF